MHSVQSLPLEEITFNFLETGHTQIECDSMHAAIELAKKNVRVYSQRECYNVIHMARRHKPYVLYQLDFSSFFDLEKVKNDLIVNRNKDTDGATVKWMKIHSIRFKKDSPFLFLYSYEPMGEYRKVVTKVQRGRRSKPAALVQLYKKQLGITAAKKKNLVQLCPTGAIPDDVHEWYNNLPVE